MTDDVVTEAERYVRSAEAEAERERILTAARIDRARVAREAAREAAREQRAERVAQRAERAATIRTAGQRAVPFIPLVAVNTLAITGQYGYAVDHLTAIPAGPTRYVAATLFAVALESIALFLGWHASAALRRRDSAAGKQLAAYLVAALVAALNYAHFAPDITSPNTTAVAFGLVSLLSPWLWAIHARATNRDALYAAGEIDPRGVKLSTGRKLWHPVRSLRVIRWAAWEGITTPAAAVAGWERHRAERRGRKYVGVRSSDTTVLPSDTGRSLVWPVVPSVGARVLPIVSPVRSSDTTSAAEGHTVAVERHDTDTTVLPSDTGDTAPVTDPHPSGGYLRLVDGPLPGVPAAPVRDRMTSDELRDAAEHTCRVAAQRGIVVTGAALGTAYGRSTTWGRQRVRAVREQGQEVSDQQEVS